MPRITGTLTQLATGLPIVNGADVANVAPEFSTLALLRAAPLETRHVYANSKRWLWNGASTATDDGTEDATSVQKTDTATGRYLPSPVQGSTLSIHLPSGSTVAASGIDTTQAIAGGRLAVNALGQQFPKSSEFNKLISGDQANVSDLALRAITSGTVFALRQQDRYIDPGTGQVRSRSWNDPDKYLVLGETGDACPQIWWTGNLGVKTVSGATSCIRIPNAYIDPDSTFAVTFLVASLSGNPILERPLTMIGGQHGATAADARVFLKGHTVYGHMRFQEFYSTYSLDRICPYPVTITGTAGAGGNALLYMDGALKITQVKKAGTIFSEDHVIGGYWDNTAGAWVSYAGFYVFAVIIHSVGPSANAVSEMHRALRDLNTVDVAVTVGQSNNGPVGLPGGAVPPDAPPMPDYRTAINENSYGLSAPGWGPSQAFPYPSLVINSEYSITHGIAPSLPGHAFVKATLGGHSLPSFYSQTDPDFELIAEPLMRAVWQIGCKVVLKHIFIVSAENEASASTPANTVRDRYAACALYYRRCFMLDPNTFNLIRVTVAKLNSQFAILHPVGTPLTQQGQALFVAADVNARLVDCDAIPLGVDNTHYSANDRIRVGMLLGAAAIGA